MQEQATQAPTQPQHSAEGFNAKGERSSGIYLHVFDGSICQKSKTPVEGWEGPIKTQNPQTKEDVFTYVFRYDSIVARIIDVNKYQKTFDSGGKVSGFDITLLAGDKKATLQLTWIEATLKRLLKVSPNIDFNKPIRISCFPITKPSGKKSVAVSFKQGDGPDPEQWGKVEEFYNSANEELPQATQDDMDGKWDYRPQERFLGVKFAENILPIIKQIAAQYPQHTTKAAAAAPAQEGQQQQVSKQEFQQAKQAFAQSQPQIQAQASVAAVQKQQSAPPQNPAQGVFPGTQAQGQVPPDDSFMDDAPINNEAPSDEIPF